MRIYTKPYEEDDNEEFEEEYEDYDSAYKDNDKFLYDEDDYDSGEDDYRGRRLINADYKSCTYTTSIPRK